MAEDSNSDWRVVLDGKVFWQKSVNSNDNTTSGELPMFKNIEIECPYCGKEFRSNFIRKHLLKEHGLTDVEWMMLSERVGSSTKFSGIAIEIVEKYLKRVYAKIGKLHK